MPIPIVSPRITFAAVEDGYIGFDEAGKRLHRLNPLGALIVELCDGKRRVEDIVALAGGLLPQGQADEIERWIEQAVEQGLLVWGDTPPNVIPDDELPTFADRLHEHGEYEAARLCRRRYAEAFPEDAANWYALGLVALRSGRRDDAAEAYARYLQCAPGDAAIEHQLIALRDETPPPRCSDNCVRKLFDGFATSFDDKLLNRLDYQAPQRLGELLDAATNGARDLTVLDLGCGTGLSGEVLRHRAARLVGIDLSPGMLDKARERGVYDDLEVAEITGWLGLGHERFDLVASCDCLTYFGDLGQVARLVAERLNPGGWFAFTTERGDRHPFRLTDSGRYAHHPDHVREAAASAGLSVLRLDQGYLRLEAGQEVVGLVALLQS